MARKLKTPSSQLSITRNIHLYEDAGAIVGGVFQNGSLTPYFLYQACEEFLDFPPGATWRIFTLGTDGSTGRQLGENHNVLEKGNYIILAPDKTGIDVRPNSKRYPRRVITQEGHSSTLTPRRSHFRDEVQKRDGGCMISGVKAPRAALGDYRGYDAAHIFPQARLNEWRELGFQNLITDKSESSMISSSKIHSPQNGLLLSKTIHALFDSFCISINPSDGYKVVCFLEDENRVDGRTLDLACRDPRHPNPICDDLLQWHLKTSILANMRGEALPPVWEMDFPEGDMMGGIMEGEDAPERMEAELFTRLMPGEVEG